MRERLSRPKAIRTLPIFLGTISILATCRQVPKTKNINCQVFFSSDQKVPERSLSV